MKNITKIFYIIAVCASIFSCSSTKKNTNIDDLTLITTAHNEGDIPFLINALETYPFYRGYTESYLYNYDYSKTKYPQLKRYAQVAQNDVTATIFFDSLLIQKQTFIVDSLSNLNIAEVGRFYKNNHTTYDFLTEILRDAYFSDVQSLDYKSRKSLYNAFKNTDLSNEIEEPYRTLRDSLMSDILAVLNPYFDSEKEIIDQIETAVRYDSQKYIEKGIEEIINAANKKNDRSLFKQIFQREDIDKYTFKEYINKAINDTFDYSYVEKLAKERLSEYLHSSQDMRSMLFNQYFNDDEYENIYIPDSTAKIQLVWVIGRDDVSNIQSIKNTGAAITAVSTAISFIPYLNTIAIAADALDIVYSFQQDGKINQAIEQLASTIYNDSSKCINEYIAALFKELKQQQYITEKNFRKIFKDEF